MIVGGESGSGYRLMHLAWVREIRNHCSAAGVPFFFKQISALRPHDDMIPADLRIRGYPKAAR